MQVMRSGPPGDAVKPWTSPAGTTTTEPPEASIVSSPARNEPDPSCSTNTSAYGWRCGPGPWPGGLAWMKKETGTPPWSRPRNVRDVLLPGSSSSWMCKATAILLAPVRNGTGAVAQFPSRRLPSRYLPSYLIPREAAMTTHRRLAVAATAALAIAGLTATPTWASEQAVPIPAEQQICSDIYAGVYP